MNRNPEEWKIELEFQNLLELEFADYFVIENTETAPGSTSEGVTECNDLTVDGVPDIQPKYVKNKTGKVKSKIQNDASKEMTVSSVPERKSRKRKAAHPPTSELVTDFIQALRKHNTEYFEGMRKYMQDKYGMDLKTFKFYVSKFLQKHVGNRVVKKTDRRRKIYRNKKSEMATTKKRVKK